MHSRSFSSFCSCSLFLTMNLLKNQVKEKTDIERTIKQIFSIAVYIAKCFRVFSITWIVTLGKQGDIFQTE